ncbi:MAG: hypothetical protein HWN68_12505 [Desulfobacterales bacterium]|nr:hypothetical protein [Desulfobacterales bacterium]
MRIVESIVLLFVLACAYIGIWLAKTKRLPEIRPLAAIEAFDEAIGRAAEMGKPVWFGTGLGTMERGDSVEVQSGLAILGRAAEVAAKYDVWLQYMTHVPYQVPIAQDLIKDGYTKGGRPDLYNPNMVIYTGGHGLDAASQGALIGVTVDYLMSERPAAILMFGTLHWEIIMTLGTAARIGAMILAGCKSTYSMASTLMLGDYALVGDEIYAAGAYLSKQPFELGVIEGQDWIKIFVIALLLVSAVVINLDLFDWSAFITM